MCQIAFNLLGQKANAFAKERVPMNNSRKWLLGGMLAAVMVMSASSATMPLPPVYLAGTGAIAGTLIDSLTYSPIDSAKVVLVHTYYTEIGALKIVHNDRIDSMITGANGAFHFNSVDTLTASLAAYTPSYSIIASDTLYNTATFSSISVADGKTTIVNFGMFPVKGDIIGTVTDSLTGFSVDSVKIVLSYTYYSTAGSLTIAHTIRMDSMVTDTSGKYHFLSVDALTMSVMPPSPSYWITATKIQYDTVITSGFGVMNSNLTTKDIVMPSLTGAIAGTIKDTVGKKAVSGAKVVLLKKTCTSTTITGCSTVRLDSTFTNGQGDYAFDDVAQIVEILAKSTAAVPIATTS
jgi:hypothetical protein